MAIHWFDDGPAEPARVGGKGASLLAMQRAGLPVPPGFCIGAESYRRFHDAAGLAPLVGALSGATDLTSAMGAADAVAPIARRLDGAALPDEVRSEIALAYHRLCEERPGVGLVAVRSSAVGEDGAEASFAGVYDTFLHLSGSERVTNAVLDCYRGLWRERAVQYRASRGVAQAAEEMAVVVMAMVASEVSGVAFSTNPISGDAGEVLINASWGLGEAVVSGQVTPDHVVAAKATGRTLAYEIGDKTLEIVLDERAGSGTCSLRVEADRATAPCLSSEDVQAIRDLACAAESHYGTPQDIEFARASGTWYLLQSRPITGLG
jgi:phosphoenolpyruvate synthase/pyruvate phosphate dikinase